MGDTCPRRFLRPAKRHRGRDDGSDSDGMGIGSELAEDEDEIKLEVLADRVAWTRPPRLP